MLAWKIGFDRYLCGNHSERHVCALHHAQHLRIVSSVYNAAEDMKDTAANCAAIMMQRVTSSIVIYFKMLCLLCSTNLLKDNLTSIWSRSTKEKSFDNIC